MTPSMPRAQELDIGSSSRLCLRLPVVCSHAIVPGSPLAQWASPSGILGDADSEIVVMVTPTRRAPCHPLGPVIPPTPM